MMSAAGQRWFWRGAAVLFMAGLYIFMFAPLIVVAGASLDSADRPYVSFPPTTLSLDWYRKIAPKYLQALGVSVILAIATAIVATLIAVPASLGLVRGQIPG